MRMKASIRTLLALVLTACVGAGPTWAERPEGKSDKQARKQSEKAREHADKRWEKGAEKEDKRWEKARKHEEKAWAREEKQAEKARKEWRKDVRMGGYFDDRHRESARAYYVQHYGEGRGCPPGLAKKNNGCMPPGQAKKYRMGQPLPREVVYYPVPQPVLVQLPAVPAGYRYVRVGNDILLLSPQSALIVDVIVNIFG